MSMLLIALLLLCVPVLVTFAVLAQVTRRLRDLSIPRIEGL